MCKIFRALSIILLCGALCTPVMDAQTRGRNNGGGEPQRTHAPSRNTGNNNSRPGNSGTRPGNNGGGNHSTPATRPGNNGQSTPAVRPGNNGTRPGNNGQSNPAVRPGNNGTRPGNIGQSVPAIRPGNSGHGPSAPAVRPGNVSVRPGTPNQGVRPGNPGVRPVGNPGGVRPWTGYRPGPVSGFGHIHFGVPSRPLMPPMRPYSRPVPPRYYVPYGGSLFGTILGLTVGTALNISLNSLVNSGYNVSAYGNDAIYLNNVNQLNLLWPDATLYYNNGYLNASQYVYSTAYADMNRYNTAYRMLVNNYGVPVSTQQLSGGGIESSWWGNNGQYVTLQYQPLLATDGVLRYYTTLSFGM